MIYFTFPNRCLTWLFSGVLLSFAALFPANAQPFQYVWSNEATMDVYSPDPAYVRNGGAPIKIRQYDTGKYQVFFGRALSEPGGYSVTKYGAGPGYCNLGFENMQLEDDIVQTAMEVWCFDGDNAPAPSQFSLLRASGATSYPPHKLAYGLVIPAASPTEDATVYRSYPGPMTAISSMTEVGDNIIRTYSVETGNGSDVSSNDPSFVPSSVLVSGFITENTTCGTQSSVSGRDSLFRVSIACGARLPSAYFLAVGKDVGYHSSIRVDAFDIVPGSQAFLSPTHSYSTSGRQDAVAVENTRGEFIVTIGPEASAGGNIQVSSVRGWGTCNVVRWLQGKAYISCWRGAIPTTVSGFTVLAVKVPDIPTPQFPVDPALGEVPIAPGVDRIREREPPR